MVPLTSEESLDGHYLHHSIQTLFGLIRDGFEDPGGDLFARGGPRTHGFSIRALDSRLFRGDAMPLLNRVKLRNRVLQRVIRLMSLSRPAKGRQGRRGRISYPAPRRSWRGCRPCTPEPSSRCCGSSPPIRGVSAT